MPLRSSFGEKSQKQNDLPLCMHRQDLIVSLFQPLSAVARATLPASGGGVDPDTLLGMHTPCIHTSYSARRRVIEVKNVR